MLEKHLDAEYRSSSIDEDIAGQERKGASVMPLLCCWLFRGRGSADVNLKAGSVGTEVESRVRTPCGHGHGHGFRRLIGPPIRGSSRSPPLLVLEDSPVHPLSTIHHHHHHLFLHPRAHPSQRIASSTERRFDLRPPNTHQDMSSRGGKLAPEVNRCVEPYLCRQSITMPSKSPAIPVGTRLS